MPCDPREHDGAWWCCSTPFQSYHAAVTHAGIQGKRRRAVADLEAS